MSNKINFFNEGVSTTIKQKILLRKWIINSINAEGLITGNINIILCSDKYLNEMNVKYLDHDTLTDVITFDYSEEKTISGDVFLGLETIEDNSKTFSRVFVDELHRVIIHGVLHLCKYNDKTRHDKEIMTLKENSYLVLRPDRLRSS
jgi:rRNA maturation RNase YbeY